MPAQSSREASWLVLGLKDEAILHVLLSLPLPVRSASLSSSVLVRFSDIRAGEAQEAGKIRVLSTYLAAQGWPLWQFARSLYAWTQGHKPSPCHRSGNS